MLRDERSWKSKKVSSSATAFGLLTAAPAVITVVCCDLIPVIIIDDYRGQRWEMVCGTSGGRWWAGALSTCSLGFLLIIYGDLRRPHTWTVWRRRCTYRGARRTNEAFRCRLCTSHMHHQNETSWPRELANTTNPHSLHVRAGKKKCLKYSKIQMLRLIMTFLADITPRHHQHHSLQRRPCYPVRCLPSSSNLLITMQLILPFFIVTVQQNKNPPPKDRKFTVRFTPPCIMF